jgi:anti-anti-sigma factor
VASLRLREARDEAEPLSQRPAKQIVPAVTTSGGGFADFGVVSSFADVHAVIAIRGEVDVRASVELGEILGAAIDRGAYSLVVDLTQLKFIDSNGLAIIARASERLTTLGGNLTIDSPSPFVRRLLGITGMAHLIHGEEGKPAGDVLGEEQQVLPLALPAGDANGPSPQNQKAAAFSPFDDVIDGALRIVVALARAIVGGADGVSVTLRRDGELATVAASDQTILHMDASQYSTGEGPCIDAAVEGRWFHAKSLDSETRWPAFSSQAQELGINSILSSPLLARDRPVGALNIYSRTVGAFTPDDQRLASIFATEASSILSDAWFEVGDDEGAARFQHSLRTRETISQAQGVIMERVGIDEDAAYTVLRREALQSGTPLHQRAESVVASTQKAEPGSGGEHDG